MMEGSTPKWTEIEHLPEWDEEFYHVYTAKKYGKWLMLKTLRPELKGQEEYEKMIEKEFEVRYNLAHPHIIMINDYEEVPGVGMCIITDDVYGDSLEKLIREHKVTDEHIYKLHHQLLDALDYIQTNHLAHHPLNASRVLFTENIGNLKLIDVGFDQKNFLTHEETNDDIYNYGVLLNQALDAVDTPHPRLRKIAAKCTAEDPSKRYSSLSALRLDLAETRSNRLYIYVIIFLVAMIGLLLWLSSGHAPAPLNP
ncbi:MAG: protein kinase [Duncaniella sp.]|nr:protein kinase [Bacteroides sp.]MDE6037308.1 protein kinase [Duncaniella sp.]MDE6066568.1 protein kinase [Duncaniella sp.]